MLGRGGVGNTVRAVIEWNTAPADFEANRQDPGISAARFVQKTQDNKEQQYAHTGRGGQGNYLELRSKGHLSDAHVSYILGDGTLPPAENAYTYEAAHQPLSCTTTQSTAQPRKVGRGGAGNIFSGVKEDEARAAKKRIGQQQQQESLKARIETDVRDSLAIPEKARLAAAGHPVGS